jgi:hypothetical protein
MTGPLSTEELRKIAITGGSAGFLAAMRSSTARRGME